MKPQAFGVYRNGHVVLRDALNVPDGTEVLVTVSKDLHAPGSEPPHRPITRGMFADPQRPYATEDDFKRAEWHGGVEE